MREVPVVFEGLGVGSEKLMVWVMASRTLM